MTTQRRRTDEVAEHDRRTTQHPAAVGRPAQQVIDVGVVLIEGAGRASWASRFASSIRPLLTASTARSREGVELTVAVVRRHGTSTDLQPDVDRLRLRACGVAGVGGAGALGEDGLPPVHTGGHAVHVRFHLEGASGAGIDDRRDHSGGVSSGLGRRPAREAADPVEPRRFRRRGALAPDQRLAGSAPADRRDAGAAPRDTGLRHSPIAARAPDQRRRRPRRGPAVAAGEPGVPALRDRVRSCGALATTRCST